MAESKGIKETKEVMEFIFSFVDAIGKAKADDKFSWTDARYFIDPVKKLFEAVDNIEEVIPEITDIDDEEYELMVDCTLLKNFTSLVSLSEEFRESVSKYFLLRINHEHEYVIYCLRLNNCLRDDNIMYNS